METNHKQDETVYKVVVNHEEQYSIWPVNRKSVKGWRDIPISGTKEECLAYIKKAWIDIRPLSIKRKVSGHKQEQTDDVK